MRNTWQVRLSGGLELRELGGPAVRFRTRKAASLFALLASYPGTAFERARLCETLWPERDPNTSKPNLRQALSEIRAVLEPAGTLPGTVLISDRTHVRLEASYFHTDLGELETACASKDLHALEQAVHGHGGELLAGWSEHWIAPLRARAADLYSEAVRLLVNACRKSNEPQKALIHARRLVEANPLDEDAQGLLIRVLIDLGRAEDAVQQFRSFKRLLMNEYGEEPEPSLAQLVSSLEGSSGSLDIANIRTELQPAKRKAHLPVVLSRIYGRESELLELQDLFRDGASNRLMTLVGTGGAGKTRLAIEFARRVDATGKSVVFVPLADVVEAKWVLERVALSAGIELKGNVPPIRQLAEQYQTEAPVMLLDNLEQLVPEVAGVVLQLLGEVSGLSIVATSRAPLGLPGEQVVEVSPLPIPEQWNDVSDLAKEPAVELFVDRARQAQPGFRLSDRNAAGVSDICSRLEGLPLSIELAASRLRSFTTTQLQEELHASFADVRSRKASPKERHSSLWTAIDWSYGLLSPPTQLCFTRLCVFRGGWTMDAAQLVCAEAECRDHLEILRSHSLINLEGTGHQLRYVMLESIREFVEQKLESSELTDALQRHGAYYRELSWQLHEQQRGGSQAEANERFASEQPNMLAVVERGTRGQVPIADALEVANRNYRYWEMRGQWKQARSIYEALLAIDRSESPERALALISLSNLMRLQGEASLAVPLTTECLAIREALGDQTGVSSALGHLAQLHHVLGDYGAAREHYERCISIQSEIGADWSHAMNLLNLGWLLVSMGLLDEAEQKLVESLGRMHALGDDWGVAAATGNLAEMAFQKGELEHSAQLHSASLSLFVEIEDLPAIAEELEGLAAVHVAKDNLERAVRLYGAADSLRREIASSPSPRQRERIDSNLTQCQSSLSEHQFKSAWIEGTGLSWRQAVELDMS